MAKISRNMSFETGIEEIRNRSQQSTPSLPDVQAPLPGVAGYQPQLKEVLFPPSIEQQMVEGLRPTITDRSILSPSGFADTLKSARRELQQERDAAAAGTRRDKLDKAIDQLDANEQMRQLLGTYRHVLQRA